MAGGQGQLQPAPVPTPADPPWISFTVCSVKRRRDAVGLDGLLANLVAAFAASGAGLAALSSGKVLVRRPAGDERVPWAHDEQLVRRVQQSPTALSDPSSQTARSPAADRRYALTPIAAGCSGWKRTASDRAWNDAEAAALTLAGQALGRLLEAPAPVARWAEQLDQAERQKDLETAARVASRLAHDFGNVLTGVIGFCDLSLALKAPAESQLSRYLRELQRCAQNGAELTHLLRLFCRRQAGGVPALRDGGRRRRGSGSSDAVRRLLHRPHDFRRRPAAGRHRRRPIASGACRAFGKRPRRHARRRGRFRLQPARSNLSADDCLDLYGDARPGPYVEIAVADSGPGLSADVAKRLFTRTVFHQQTAAPRLRPRRRLRRLARPPRRSPFAARRRRRYHRRDLPAGRQPPSPVAVMVGQRADRATAFWLLTTTRAFFA